MASYNSNSPTVRGMEWRPSSARDLLLDASTKGVAMRFQGTAATYSHLHRFISAVQGSPGLGIEVLSQLVPDGFGTFTARPNEDVTIGTWTEDDGTTTTLFDQIDEATLDAADYIKQVVSPASAYEFRVSIGTGNLTGKRVRAVEVNAVASTPAGTGGLTLGLRVGGTASNAAAVTIGDAEQFVSKYWAGNPTSLKPWTIADAELFDTTDAVRFVSSTGGTDLRVLQGYVDFDYYTENRLGLLYTTGAPTLGWFEENISDAVLSASTYYYVHVFPLAGNASNWVKVPLLKDPNVVMALNAAASTGEHRVAYSTTLEPGNAIITTATELPGEMIPMLFDVAGTIQAQSNPYCEID